MVIPAKQLENDITEITKILDPNSRIALAHKKLQKYLDSKNIKVINEFAEELDRLAIYKDYPKPYYAKNSLLYNVVLKGITFNNLNYKSILNQKLRDYIYDPYKYLLDCHYFQKNNPAILLSAIIEIETLPIKKSTKDKLEEWYTRHQKQLPQKLNIKSLKLESSPTNWQERMEFSSIKQESALMI